MDDAQDRPTIFRAIVPLAAMIGIGAVFVPAQLGLLALASARPEVSALFLALPPSALALAVFAVGYLPMSRNMVAAEQADSYGSALRRAIPSFMVAGALVTAMLLPVTGIVLDSAHDARAAALSSAEPRP